MLRSLTLLAAAAAIPCPPASAQWVLAKHTSSLFGIDDAEFTPDGRYLVVREDTAGVTALVYRASTGALIYQHQSSGGDTLTGTCQDAVAVTNDRAIVLGSEAVILDLQSMTTLADLDLGPEPRDVVITPDGTLAAVRGGDGLYLIDMIGAAIVAQASGEPAEYQGTIAFDVDSVVADDAHAVFTSELVNGTVRTTRVTIFELHPGGGGPPQVVFETTVANDQDGKPHDLSLMPDGTHAAVRSDLEVGLYELAGPATRQVWLHGLHGNPGPMLGFALDSIEVTNSRIATISHRFSASEGAQLDVFDLVGRQKFATMAGEPHDLALTPTSERVAVRTNDRVVLFDVGDLPPGDQLSALDEVDFAGSAPSWMAGLDSIVASDDRVAALATTGQTTMVAVWDTSGDRLAPFFETMQHDKALDLEIAPDGSRVIFGFWTSFMLVDLRTAENVLTAEGTTQNGSVPWCDGVAIDGQRAAAFGVGQINGQGWISIVDLFEQPQRYCPARPNSTGASGELVVSGSASLGSDDLVLWASSLPSQTIGLFVYGDQKSHVPFGDGFACVTGQIGRFHPARASDTGVAIQPIDYSSLPGASIVAGSTWHFQHAYRDSLGSTAAFNTTDALSIRFGN